MNTYVTIYNLAMATSLVVSAGVALLMWRYRRLPGAWAMMAVSAGVFVWTLGYVLEANAITLERQLFFTGIGYIGSLTVPPAWFAFALKYSSGDRLLHWKHVWLLSIIPVIAIIMVWTNDWHHIMWSGEHLENTGAFSITVKTYGPGFWVALLHNYVLIGAGIVVLAAHLLRGPALYKRQAISLFLTILLPLIWNVIYIFDLGDLPRKDLTPVMFSFSGLFLALGFIRFQLFKVVPFAYKFVFRELKDGILLFDDQGCLLETNTAALRMLAADVNIIGKTISELRPVSPMFSAIALRKDMAENAIIEFAGGNLFYEVTTTPMRDNHGRLVGWSASISDITAPKKDELRLAEALEKEQELRRSLEAEVHKRARYTRALVHELKTPLTPVIATSEILMSELKEEPWARMARNIHRGGRNLDRKVDELLDLARSEIGTLKVEITDVFPTDVMRDAVKEMQPSAQGRKQRLEVEIETPLPAIKADKARLRQVICSLVDNAFKFSRDEGTVVLRARHEDDRLVVEVEDNGPGLTEAEQARLFQIYERSDTDRRRLSGLGLGLALSKSLVELHGGAIWVKSQKDSGSTFGFSVPAGGPADWNRTD